MPACPEPIVATLRDLECLLLLPGVRSDPERLGALLHADFHEVGASGGIFTRDEVLAEFRGAPPWYEVWAQDFELHEVVPGVALLKYRSAHVGEDGVLTRHVARTSLWQCVEGRWRLRHHQGTLTVPFKQQST